MKYYTIDIEYHIETADYQCAVLYHPDFNFTDEISSESFVKKILLLPDKKNIIYSHYGGGSDFLFLLRELVGRSDIYFSEKRFYEASGKIISFTIWYKNKEYQFRDSYCILFDSLQKLAESFLNKSKIYDSGKLETKYQQQLQCFNDARMLWEIIEKFMIEINYENLPLTYSSLAFQELQKSSDLEKLMVQTPEEYEMFLPWFVGGHVDVYRRYAEPVFTYDIKSSYSSVQWETGCPVGKFIEVKKRNANKAGLYVIKTNCNIYNPFLWTKQNGKLYFVNGDDSFLVTDLDLDMIEKLNYDYKILNGYEWTLDKDFFKSFVEKWYNYKEMGGARKLIGKYMLNGGGYGKFAIKRERDHIVFGEKAERFFSPDYNIGTEKTWVNFWYSQIHIGSRITSGGRIKLYSAQEKFQHDLCYSDTDSIHSNSSVDSLDSSGSLGSIDFGGNFDRGYWLGNKFYGLASCNKFKCILKGFPEKFTEKNFVEGLKGNLNFKYVKKRLMKMKSALRTSSDFVHVQEFLREVRTIEIKRKLSSNGINTEPYFLKKGKLL